jgi:hypothetical protein
MDLIELARKIQLLAARRRQEKRVYFSGAQLRQLPMCLMAYSPASKDAEHFYCRKW